MASAFTAKSIFMAVDRTSAVMRKITRANKAFAAKTKVAFARVERAARKLTSKVGFLGVALGGALLMQTVTSTIGVFKDFEQANASLAAVMGVTVEENKELAIDAKRLGAITAKSATEVVGLQEAFARLGFEKKSIINMTEATISGSVAMQGGLADTAELVGAIVKTFDKFESVNAPDIIDKLTKSTQTSALNFEKLQTSLPIVAGAANAAKVPFTRLLSELGKLSDAGIDASSSATALRNIYLVAAKKGVPYQKLLDKVRNSTDSLATANKLFGVRGAVVANILAKNTEGLDELDKKLQKAKGTAKEAADKQLDTLQGSLTILKSAWEGFILSVEDGNGKIGAFLKTTVKVVTEMLSIASGTAKAKNQLSAAEIKIRNFAEEGLFLVNILKWVVIGFTALKVALIANKAIMVTAGFIRFIAIFTKIAMATNLWTAAQWALDIALNANPIGVIIIAIIALIGIVTLMIKKWDEWGGAVAFMTGPFGMMVSLIKSFADNWERIKASFTSGGFKSGIKSIGKTIIDSILAPFQKFNEMLYRITGLERFKNIAKITELGRSQLFNEEDKLINNKEQLTTTKTAIEQERIKREETINKQEATLTINNQTGSKMSLDAPNMFPVKLTPTN